MGQEKRLDYWMERKADELQGPNFGIKRSMEYWTVEHNTIRGCKKSQIAENRTGLLQRWKAVRMEFEETADINYYKSTNQMHLLMILWEVRELGP